MAEYAIYKVPEWDVKACQNLGGAIIRQAYEDYIYARKRIESIKNPGVSTNCTRMLERIMAEEVARKLDCGMRKAFKHLNLIDPGDIPVQHSKALGQAESIIHFFYSDSFQILAGEVDPQFLIREAEKEVHRWVMDGKPRSTGRGAMSKTRKEIVP